MSTEAPQSRNSSLRPPLWAVAIILALLGLALFGDKGVLRALQAGRQKTELESRVRELEAANADLRKQIEALRNDPRTIENVARKELGMVKDDEIVYQFRNPPEKSVQGRPSTKAGE